MFMRGRLPTMERLLFATVALALFGCNHGSGGNEATALGTMDFKRLRAMADIYSGYLNGHRSQAPPNDEAFRAYLATKQADLDRAGLTIDEMFVSPRGVGTIQWIYGIVPPTNKYGMTFLAYETTPVDGKRLAIALRGQFQEMDETQFRATFPNATK
jgi:hypothetical protein